MPAMASVALPSFRMAPERFGACSVVAVVTSFVLKSTSAAAMPGDGREEGEH